MKVNVIAKWFLQKNNGLPNGCDDNSKMNYLIYFSNLMHQAIHGENLVTEVFTKGAQGPHIWDNYKEHLSDDLQVQKIDEDEKLSYLLNLINYTYVDFTEKQFAEEFAQHNILQVAQGEKVDFSKMDDRLKNMMVFFYNENKSIDYKNMEAAYVNGNRYLYLKNNLVMDEETIAQLKEVEGVNETYFVEKQNGELVFS